MDKHRIVGQLPTVEREERSRRRRSIGTIFRETWVDAVGALTQGVIDHLPDLAAPSLARFLDGANLVALGAAVGLGDHWAQSPVGAVVGGVVAEIGGGLVKRGAQWVARRRKPAETEARDDRVEQVQVELAGMRDQLARQQSRIDQLMAREGSRGPGIDPRAVGPDQPQLREPSRPAAENQEHQRFLDRRAVPHTPRSSPKSGRRRAAPPRRGHDHERGR